MSKSDLLKTYLEERGLHLSSGRMGWQSVHCYRTAYHMRGDRNPSASVNLVTGHYRCFTCGIEGDVYDLIKVEEGLDFAAAKAKMGVMSTKPKEEETWL